MRLPRALLTLAALGLCALGLCVLAVQPAHTEHLPSPYATLTDRSIKALSAEQQEQLLSGHGMGLALAAELNDYPGPRHVLDLAEELVLTADQVAAVTASQQRMHEAAVELGRRIVGLEAELDQRFSAATISSPELERLVEEIAAERGRLRLTHLQAHLEMKATLSAEQVAAYARLRGYAAAASGAPENGHTGDHHGGHPGTVGQRLPGHGSPRGDG